MAVRFFGALEWLKAWQGSFVEGLGLRMRENYMYSNGLSSMAPCRHPLGLCTDCLGVKQAPEFKIVAQAAFSLDDHLKATSLGIVSLLGLGFLLYA